MSSIGALSTYIIPRRFTHILSDYFNLFYSGRISKSFRKCGSHFYAKRYITLYNPEYIEIGNDVYIYNNAILGCHSDDSKLMIGNGVMIGEGCHISCVKNVTINDDVLMGRRVHITDNSHGDTTFEQQSIPPLNRPTVYKGSVTIHKNVWLGDNVIILPGVDIGEGCVVGASSVVTKDLPPYSICVGIPAKVIKISTK